MKLLASAPGAALALIYTYLQIGDDGGRKFPEPFQRFTAEPEEPFKRFQKATERSDTQLKQGE